MNTLITPKQYYEFIVEAAKKHTKGTDVHWSEVVALLAMSQGAPIKLKHSKKSIKKALE